MLGKGILCWGLINVPSYVSEMHAYLYIQVLSALYNEAV